MQLAVGKLLHRAGIGGEAAGNQRGGAGLLLLLQVALRLPPVGKGLACNHLAYGRYLFHLKARYNTGFIVANCHAVNH